MKNTYRVMQATGPGMLAPAERPVPVPGVGEVLIDVEVCGVCGADLADIDRASPAARRVPGHEVVGRIAALGAGTPSRWQVGQRVGVGRLGGHCNECRECRRGQFQLCRHQPVVGATSDGGYAEMMIARATALVAIPDELSSVDAAPLLCAGLATFNALKRCGAEAGDRVAILGIGGLGHLALQYARKMGFEVVAIGRGADVAADALALGAHRYVDNTQEDVAAVLQAMGGAQAIVSTIAHPAATAAAMAGLAPQGRLVALAAGKEPLTLASGPLVVGERSVVGSLTGTPYQNERTLAFSMLAGIRPRLETLPLEKASEAVRRVRSGAVQYRMVLLVRGPAAAAPATGGAFAT